MPRSKPRVVVITGPTASGKSSIAVDLAERFGGEIVSADSIQVYRYMDIGSAKPTQAERARVPHRMIDVRDPDEPFTAGDYVLEGRQCIEDMAARGKTVFIVGGTGLYIRTLLGGIIGLPAADRALRASLRRELDEHGPEAMLEVLRDSDPIYAEKIGASNPVRLLRAVEVLRLTGKPMSRLHAEHGFPDRPYEVLFLCLCPKRSTMNERIDKRVDSMISGGLIEEVRSLREKGYSRELKPMRSIGYRQVACLLDGEMDEKEATALIKRDTRRYAKRQLTWFRSEPEAVWFDPQDRREYELLVRGFLGH